MNPVILLLAGLWVGLTKGGVGGPITGAVLLPLLVQAMSFQEAVGVMLPLLMFGDLFAMRAYWRRWDMHHIRLLLPSAVAGVLAGVVLLTTLPEVILWRLLGVITLGIIGYKILSDRLRALSYTPRDWHGWLAGVSSGFVSALANNGGPPVTAYLLLNRPQPLVFIGTITLFFTAVNLMKLPLYLATSVIDLDLLLSVALIFPVIPFGVWAGRWIVERIDQRVFEWLMIVLLVIASVILLTQSPDDRTGTDDQASEVSAFVVPVEDAVSASDAESLFSSSSSQLTIQMHNPATSTVATISAAHWPGSSPTSRASITSSATIPADRTIHAAMRGWTSAQRMGGKLPNACMEYVPHLNGLQTVPHI